MDDLRNGPETTTSVASLVSGIVKDVQELTSQQLALFKKEMADDFRKTRDVAVSWALGLAAALVAAIMLTFTVAELLTWAIPTVPRWVWYGVVGVAVAIAGGILFYAGQKKLQSFNPLPEQSVQALKENIQCLTNPR